jgi:hypothetical protein
MRVTIANHGRQPVTVTSVGMTVKELEQREHLLRRVLFRERSRGGFFFTMNEEPLLLMPGDARQFELDVEVFLGPDGVREGTELQPYAKDSRERIIRGGSVPVFRATGPGSEA